MRISTFIFGLSAAILLLMTAYAAASLYFCAVSLKGDIAGCAAMIGDDVLRSTTVQIGAVLAAFGLFFALWSRTRR